MALRPQDKVTERELSDIVVDKLNYLGNLKLSSNIAVRGQHGSFQDGEVLIKGTRVHDILQGILDESFERPYKYPTLELTGVGENIEVGNTVSITIVPVFTQNDAGKLTRFKFEKSISGADFITLYDSDNIIPYTEPSIAIVDNPNILSFRATAWFEEGKIKYSNGDEIEGHIEAGSVSTRLTISGIRKCFYGAEAGITIPVTTNEEVRRLPESTTFGVEEGSIISIVINPGTTRITFAYPAYVRDPQKILSKKLGYDIKDIFEKTSIRVKGFNGYTDIEYKVFTYIPDVGYPSDDIYTFYI